MIIHILSCVLQQIVTFSWGFCPEWFTSGWVYVWGGYSVFSGHAAAAAAAAALALNKYRSRRVGAGTQTCHEFNLTQVLHYSLRYMRYHRCSDTPAHPGDNSTWTISVEHAWQLGQGRLHRKVCRQSRRTCYCYLDSSLASLWRWNVRTQSLCTNAASTSFISIIIVITIVTYFARKQIVN